MNKFSFLLFAFCISFYCNSQTFRFNEYTTEDGISQNFIYSISQDRKGYLWVGTGEGLCQFDGKSFKTYTTQDGLSEDVITCSFESKDGSLYFGHNNGTVTKYNNESFTAFKSNQKISSTVNQLCSKSEVIYFVAQNEGLNSIQEDQIVHHGTFGGSAFYSMFCFDENNIILGTSSGLLLVKKTGDKFNLVKKYLDKSWISSIHRSNQPGVCLIGIQSGDVKKCRLNNGTLEFQNIESELALSGVSIKSAIEDSEGNLWIATYGQGLIKIKFSTDSSQINEKIIYNTQTGLNSDFINSVYQDREGNIWIGTFGAGLSTLIDDFFTFYSHEDGKYGNSVSSFWVDEQDHWYGVENGLIRISKQLENGWQFYDATNGLVNDVITSLYKRDSILWIGTKSNGLYKYDSEKQKISKVDWNHGNLCNNINQITADEDLIWVATEGGLVIYNPTYNSVNIIRTTEGLRHNSIKTIVNASDGKLWMGTHSRYLAVLNNSSIEEFEITNSGEIEIVSITEDNHGDIWLATSESGVYKKEGKKFLHFSTENGLKSNYCYAIHPDANGIIWVGHRGGLSKIDPATNKTKIYDHNDGITSQVNPNAFFIGPKKYLWIGTKDGAIKYDPVKDKLNTTPPVVNIKTVTVGDKKYDVNEPIHLPYGNYRVQFEFIGISFKNPSEVKYKYQLVGHDAVPSDITQETIITYGKLSDGNYSFQVYACNEDDVWTTVPALFTITIDAPIWKKWWFYLIIITCITVVVILLIKWRLKRLNDAKIELERQLKIKTKEVVEKAEKIEDINKDLTDSINYAKRIQNSLLPLKETLSNVLPDSFIFFKPRDIVSGDFYYVHKYENKLIVACVDCTGHGVPGAFMSMIGSVTLRNLYSTGNYEWKNPVEILEKLDNEIETILKQKKKHKLNSEESFFQSRDGMDLSLCEINLDTNEVQLCSAMRTSVIIQNGELSAIGGDKRPIGGGNVKNVPYTLKKFQMQKGDILCLFTDGYSDQFGGPEGRKLKLSGASQIMAKLIQFDRSEYENIISNGFNNWLEGHEQIDDVLFIGIVF